MSSIHDLTNIKADNRDKEDQMIDVYKPMAIMSGKISPEPSSSIEFSNYDILLMAYEADEPARFVPGSHVGNQRLRVLLSLFRHKYLQAEGRGDEEECRRIAQEVLDTVCRKCVPNGRFFEKGHDDQWHELQLGSFAIAVIRSALKNEPKDCLHSAERSQKRVCRGSIVSTESQENAVASPDPFDVVCEADGLRLKQDCDHTGNNRLKVMLDMRLQSYKKSGHNERQTIAQEVVYSIMDDTSSQFLIMGEPSGMYKPISRERATACIKHCLDTRADGKKRKFRESEVKKLMDRKKKKAVLGRFERLKGKKYKLPSSSSSPPTTFKVFQTASTFGLVEQQVGI